MCECLQVKFHKEKGSPDSSVRSSPVTVPVLPSVGDELAADSDERPTQVGSLLLLQLRIDNAFLTLSKT